MSGGRYVEVAVRCGACGAKSKRLDTTDGQVFCKHACEVAEGPYKFFARVTAPGEVEQLFPFPDEVSRRHFVNMVREEHPSAHIVTQTLKGVSK